MKFATKLMLLVLGIVTSLALIVSYVVYTWNVHILETEIKSVLEETAIHILDNIDRMLFERFADVKTIATDPVISSRESTPRQITERLVQFRNTRKAYISISFFDLNRVRIADTSGLDVGRQDPLEGYWKNDLIRESSVIDVSESATLRQAVINLTSPVEDKNGETFGVVVARMSISKLHYVPAGSPIREKYAPLGTELIDRDGLLLYSETNRKGVLKENYSERAVVKMAMAGGRVGSLTHLEPASKERKLYVFVREQGYLDFAGNDWILLIDIPARVAHAPAVKLRNRMLAIMAGASVVSLIIAFYFSRSISNPIAELTKGVEIIGRGDLGHKVAIGTRDEIGTLANAFNRMVSNLKRVTASRDELEKEIAERKRAEREVEKHRRHLEDMVRERTAELTEAIEELEAFAYSVSHDLRAPLRAIDGFSQMLVEDYGDKLDAEGHRLLAVVQHSAKDMGQLIDDLLAFSRLGRTGMKVATVNMDELARRVIEDLRHEVPGRHVQLNVDTLPATAGDQAMIRQVFANLLTNAIKFTRPREYAVIEVGAMVDGSQNTYFVKDNGVGFDMKYADKLFQVFQRLHSTDEFEGTGIGLALVQRVITRHGGRVWAEGEVDKGATFCFALPVISDQ